MADVKLYLRDTLSLGASDVVYVSKADGSSDGKVTLTAMSAIFASTLSTTFAAASHTHVLADITDVGSLATYAAITPSANVQTILGAADYSAIRTSLGLVIGTNVQAYSANLTTFAGIAPSANVQTLLGAANYAAFRTSLSLVPGTDVQAYNANLAAFAGLTLVGDRLPYANGAGTLALATFTAAGRALIDDADAAAQRTTLGLGTVATLASDTDGTLAANSDTNIATQKAVKTYVTAAVAAGVTDGDKGDITVSSSGTVWTVDNAAVTLAKIANASASSKLLGSGSSGSGSAYAEITLGTGLSMSSTTLSVAAASHHDVTVSRATNTDYTNSTGGPIFVTITFQTSAQDAGANLAVATVNLSIAQSARAGGANLTVSAWVPNSAVYKLVTFGSGSFTITHVDEWY